MENKNIIARHDEYVMVKIEEKSNLRVWIKVPPCGV